jgi:imidazolonepropionase-like amidohydrolase
MSKRWHVWICSLIIGFVGGSLMQVPGNGQGRALVIEGGTLIDGTGGTPLRNAVIVIEGDRIQAVGTKGQVSYPPDARVIQADGRTILPGLFECHIHYREWMPPIFLRYGITTVADTANPTAWIIAQREMLRRGIIRGPRMYVTGRRLGGPLPGRKVGVVPNAIDGSYTVNVRTVEEARAEVRSLVAQGVDAIKVHDGLTPDMIKGAVDQAHELGMETVVGHEYNGRDSAMAGLKYIEHSPPIARATIREPEKQKLANPEYYMEESLYDPLIELFLEQGVYVNVPLWSARAFNPRATGWGWEQLSQELARDPSLAFVPAKERATWTSPSEQGNLSSQEREQRIVGLQKVHAFIKKYAQAGGKVVAGSDTGSGDVPGLWTHYEMQSLVDAGLTPMQAILSATKWPAELFHLEKELGTIEVGKRGDVIVIAGDPLANIATTRNVLWVVKDGQVVDTTYDPQFVNPLPRTANVDEAGPEEGPAISTLTPIKALQGDPEVMLKIGGRDFTSRSVVRFDTTNLRTQFVSDSELTATIDPRLLQSPGTYALTVVNPGSGGGTSNVVFFLVDFRY